MINEMHVSWRMPLDAFRKSHEGRATLHNLHCLLQRDQAIYHPARENVFAAFRETPFRKVRVVIIGQDPYPNPDYATGLAFSVPDNHPMPASMAKIYCAIATDLRGRIPTYGNLNDWARDGVLLLNRVLTFSKDGKNNADKDRGWEVFTEAVVKALSDDKTRRLHFMLWGEKAEVFKDIIDTEQHYTYITAHPAAPHIKSAHRFRTCRHFSAVNNVLGASPINWLPQEARQ